MKEGRTPCINPRCQRTGAADEFPGEMICGKCFRTLPVAVRKEHRGYWRQLRNYRRRIARSLDEVQIGRLRNVEARISRNLGRHWDEVIKPFFVAPEKPEGLDAFLEEVGL